MIYIPLWGLLLLCVLDLSLSVSDPAVPIFRSAITYWGVAIALATSHFTKVQTSSCVRGGPPFRLAYFPAFYLRVASSGSDILFSARWQCFSFMGKLPAVRAAVIVSPSLLLRARRRFPTFSILLSSFVRFLASRRKLESFFKSRAPGTHTHNVIMAWMGS